MTRALAIGLVALLLTVPAFPVHALPILADVFSEPRPFTEAPVPALPEEGGHVVVHFSRVTAHGEEEAVIRLANPAGEEVVHVLILDDSRIRVSDGYAADGSIRYVSFGSIDDPSPYRFDVFANGDTVTLRPSWGPDGPVTVEPFHPATKVTQVDARDLAPHRTDLRRVSFYPPDARVEDLYRYGPLTGPDGWQAYDPGDRLEVTRAAGHLSYGRLEVHNQIRVPGLTLEEQAYVHADVTAYGGRYIAEASFRPWAVGIDFPDGVPDHQAIVAGLSGPAEDPAVAWALTAAAQEEKYDQWSFYLVDGDGHRTRVSDTWHQDEWHTVRVFVDEHAGTLAIQVDEADTVKVFDGGLPISERVATGDVWTDDLRWTGIGFGYYDNLAVTPWEADT